MSNDREPDPGVSCAVLHEDRDGNTIPCPDRRGSPVQRPPARLYEVRTVHGEIYLAEGDVIEQGDGWFTLWGDVMTVALRLPEADVRSVRHVTEGELDTIAEERDATTDQPDTGLAQLLLAATGIDLASSTERPDYPTLLATACRTVIQSEAARDKVRRDRGEARQWARHGYEIGQRHCGWTDHGVAPAWLTEGWPRHFDSCEHLKQAADFDMALTRVRALHRPAEHRGVTICAECSAWDGETTDNAPVAHPCATIRALDGDTTSKEQQA